MPLISGPPLPVLRQEHLPKPVLPSSRPAPSFGETARAAYQSNSTLLTMFPDASFNVRGMRLFDFAESEGEAPVEGYDPFDDERTADFTGPELRRVALSESPAETLRIIGELRREREYRDTLARSGGLGVALSIAAGLVDPMTALAIAIPVAAPATWGSRAARVGAGILGSVAVDSAAEVLLHQRQAYRTWQDSALNIGAGALLTGVLGTIATRVPKSEFDLIRAQLQTELQGVPDQSLGAAAASPGPFQWGNVDLDDLTIDTGVARAIARSVGRMAPIDRLMTSPFKAARQLTTEMLHLPWQLKGNVKGTVVNPEALQTRINIEHNTRLYKLLSAEEALYGEYLERVGREGKPLKKSEFGQAATWAARGESTGIAEADNLGKLLRQMYDKDREALKALTREAGESPFDGLDNYVTQMWDADALRRDPQRFIEKMKKFLRENPLLPEETPDIKAARTLAAKEGDIAKPDELASVVANREAKAAVTKAIEDVRKNSAAIADAGRELRKAERSVDDIVRKIEDLEEQRATVRERAQAAAEEELEAAYRLHEDAAAQFEELQARRLEFPEDATGSEVAALERQIAKARERAGRTSTAANNKADTVELRVAEAEARIDRQVARLRERALAAEDVRAQKQQAAIEAEQRHADLRQGVKDARAAQREAAKAAREARAAASTVRQYESALEKAKAAVRDDVELQDEAMRIREDILGTYHGMHHVGKVANPKVLRERKLNIDPRDFEEFLVHDFDRLLSSYSRTMVPHIESLRVGLGDVEWGNRIQAIRDEARILTAQAKTAKEVKRIDDAAKAVVTDLERVRARLMNRVGGTGRAEYQEWTRAIRLVRAYNYVRLLGGQTLSSVTDLGHVMTRYGTGRTTAAITKYLLNSEFRKLSKANARRVGAAVQTMLDSRIATMADIAEPMIGGRGAMATAERLAERGTTQFTKLTLMRSWNEAVQSLTAMLEGDALLRAAKNYDSLSAFKKGQLASAGFGPDEMRRLAAMPVEDVDGLLRAGTDAWPDRDLAAKFEQSMANAAEVMTIVKGAGDLPLIMDSELAKTAFQFKSFGIAAINRIMIPVAQGLARGDAATASGAAMMAALSALVYGAKEVAAGREPATDPGTVAKNVFEWSGLFGPVPDIWDPTRAVLPEPFRSLGRGSRYQGRTKAETVLGPTFGTYVSLFQAVSGLTGPTDEFDATPSVTARELHQFRKLIPYQNHFLLRRVINAMEGETAEMLGLEGATPDNFVERLANTEEAAK